MSDQSSYQGWSNYPTWCVNLWLGNDEGLYAGTIARVEAVRSEDHPTHTSYTVEESVRYGVADALKFWVTYDLVPDLVPDLDASFPADLLSYALGEVDWHEIADAWIETANEQVGASA